MLHIACHQRNENYNSEIPLRPHLNGPKLEHGHHRMLVRVRSSRDCHAPTVGMPNGEATLEGSLAVTHKTKHTPVTQFHHRTCYLPIGAENLCPIKNLHVMFIAALPIILRTLKHQKTSQIQDSNPGFRS